MRNLLLPDYIFGYYGDVTPEFLKSIGIDALLIDIDNTLAPYEQIFPDKSNIEWFESLKTHGIKASLISNNNRDRVEKFNEKLKLDAYAKSGKPFPKTLRLAMSRMGSNEKNTAILGDQLLTDAAAGKRLGLVTIIVPPIKDKSNAFFRIKRAMEVKHIKKYVKIHGEECMKICSFWINREYKKNRKRVYYNELR